MGGFPTREPKTVRSVVFLSIANTWSDQSDLYDWLQISLKPKFESKVTIAAIKSIGEAGTQYPSGSKILKERAKTDENYAVRQTAVQELARGWKDDPETLAWLKEREPSDPIWLTYQEVLKEQQRAIDLQKLLQGLNR